MIASIENMVDLSRAVVEPITLPLITRDVVGADVLRLDAIHPIISGNKWYKLRHYLEQAISGKFSSLLSFGGAYSNHIVALAYAGRCLGLPSTGIIRGEKPTVLSHTLSAALDYGMHLEFVSRIIYKQKNDVHFINDLQNKYPGALIIPEGGAGETGVRGSAEMVDPLIAKNYSHVMCAVGTGTMLKGLSHSLQGTQQLIGICVLKVPEGLLFRDDPWQRSLLSAGNTRLYFEYHFGGYAKKNQELFRFMNEWFNLTGIPTDFVYTAKLFYAFQDLVNKKYFDKGSRVLLIHSGGLQGNGSLSEGTLNF